MAGSMGSQLPAISYEGCSGKKKQKNGRKQRGEYDSIGGTPFHRVRAIAKKHNVFISRLRHYADHNAKCHHGYDTDSSVLGGDSGSDDSWDGDSDTTM